MPELRPKNHKFLQNQDQLSLEDYLLCHYYQKLKLAPKLQQLLVKYKVLLELELQILFPKNFDVEALWLQEWQELLKELLSRQPEQM